MMRIAALALAGLTLLAGCGADGEPVPPTRNAQSGLISGF